MSNANTILESSPAIFPASAAASHIGLPIQPLRDTPGRTELSANDTVRPVGRVGIIGAGSMGIEIAIEALGAGIPVTVFDKRDTLDQGLAQLRSAYETSVRNGRLAPDQRDRRLALFGATVRFHHLKDCDLIVEVMQIEAEVREKFFRWLDEIARPSSVLVANVSGPCLDHIARCTRRPADVLGLRPSGPDDLSEGPDLVRGRQSSREAYATAAGLLVGIGKPTP